MNDNLTRIGDSFTVAIGGTPSRKRKEFWDHDKKTRNVWVSIRDISGASGTNIFDSAEYISDEGAANSNVKLIPENVALMTFKLTVGKTIVTGAPLYTNEAIAAFLPRPGVEADPYYLAAVLPTLNYDVDTAVKGKTLNKAKIENALLPLPGIKLQKRIAEILRSINDSLLMTQRTIGEAQKLKEGLMRQLFSTGVGHTEFTQSDLGKIPANWRVGGFSDYTDLTNKDAIKPGPFGSSIKKQNYVASGYKIYGQEQVIAGDPFWGDYYITAQKYEELKPFKVSAGDILMSLVGTIGKVLIVPENFEEGIINPRLIKITPDRSKATPQFIAYLLASSMVKRQLRSKSHGGTMDIINKGMLMSVSVPIIPLDEQKKIVEILLAIDQKISINKEIEKQQKNLRKGLIQDILSGRTRL